MYPPKTLGSLLCIQVCRRLVPALPDSLLIAAGQEVDKPGRDVAIRVSQRRKLDVRNYWHHHQGDGCAWAA